MTGSSGRFGQKWPCGTRGPPWVNLMPPRSTPPQPFSPGFLQTWATYGMFMYLKAITQALCGQKVPFWALRPPVRQLLYGRPNTKNQGFDTHSLLVHVKSYAVMCVVSLVFGIWRGLLHLAGGPNPVLRGAGEWYPLACWAHARARVGRMSFRTGTAAAYSQSVEQRLYKILVLFVLV